MYTSGFSLSSSFPSSSPKQSPLVPGQLTTAEVTSWIGELQLSADGTVVVNFDTGDPNALSQTFTGLQKGTSYRARVAGVNIHGPGAYSELMTAETSVDREFEINCACMDGTRHG